MKENEMGTFILRDGITTIFSFLRNKKLANPSKFIKMDKATYISVETWLEDNKNKNRMLKAEINSYKIKEFA